MTVFVAEREGFKLFYAFYTQDRLFRALAAVFMFSYTLSAHIKIYSTLLNLSFPKFHKSIFARPPWWCMHHLCLFLGAPV